jgi:hypothetical protein
VQSPAFGPNSTAVAGLQDSTTLANPRVATGLFARAWVYIPDRSLLKPDNYFSLMEVHQDRGDNLGIALQIQATNSIISNWTPTPNATAPLGVAFPRDQWTCVEWAVTFGANGTSTASIGDSAPTTLNATNTKPSPPYNAFFLGAFFASGPSDQPAFELWIDDLVLDQNHIGCGS